MAQVDQPMVLVAASHGGRSRKADSRSTKNMAADRQSPCCVPIDDWNTLSCDLFLSSSANKFVFDNIYTPTRGELRPL